MLNKKKKLTRKQKEEVFGSADKYLESKPPKQLSQENSNMTKSQSALRLLKKRVPKFYIKTSLWMQKNIGLPPMPFLSLTTNGWVEKTIDQFSQWAPPRSIYFIRNNALNQNLAQNIEPCIDEQLILRRVCSCLQELIGILYSITNLEPVDSLAEKQRRYRALLLWAYIEYMIPPKKMNSQVKRFFFSIKRFVVFHFKKNGILKEALFIINLYKYQKNEFASYLLKESFSNYRLFTMEQFSQKLGIVEPQIWKRN